MKLELDKYGIQMPAFSKIGGLLANELSVDEAAGKTHAFPRDFCNLISDYIYKSTFLITLRAQIQLK